MEFWGDDRGQSVQVGAILLFGILIVLLATIQTTVIPGQNAAVEFDHSRAVQSDMQDLRNGLLRASSGDAAPTRVKLGTAYPNRLFFVNPPPATGRLRTVGEEEASMNVTVANGSGRVAVVSDYENAREYWATASEAGVYNTSEIEYVPDYSQYDGAPTTVYDNSVLFNTFDNGANRTLTGQRLVQGNTINLLALRGDLAESGASTETIDVETLSEQRRTVTVESGSDDPLYVNVTSRLSASVWNDDLLGSNAEASNAGPVTIDGESYHRIAIELDEGTYRLRGAAVGIGAVSDAERENATEPAYLVVTKEYEPVANGTNGTMTVEVRDQFNNPVTGANVTAEVSDDYLNVSNKTKTGDSVRFKTNAEGRATIEYNGTKPTTGDAWLNASLDGASAGYEFWNESDIDVLSPTVGGVNEGNGSEVNPGSAGELINTDAELTSNNNNAGRVELSFNNTIDSTINITQARLNFYYYASNNNRPTSADLIDTEGTTQASDIQITGDYVELETPIEVGPDAEGPVFSFEFDDTVAASGSNRDFFVFTLVFEANGETQRTTYFVGL
jgi:hypothetical protein